MYSVDAASQNLMHTLDRLDTTSIIISLQILRYKDKKPVYLHFHLGRSHFCLQNAKRVFHS